MVIRELWVFIKRDNSSLEVGKRGSFGGNNIIWNILMISVYFYSNQREISENSMYKIFPKRS